MKKKSKAAVVDMVLRIDRAVDAGQDLTDLVAELKAKKTLEKKG